MTNTLFHKMEGEGSRPATGVCSRTCLHFQDNTYPVRLVHTSIYPGGGLHGGVMGKKGTSVSSLVPHICVWPADAYSGLIDRDLHPLQCFAVFKIWVKFTHNL